MEVFLLTRKNATDWEVLVKPGKKLQKGARIKFSDELSCEILDTTDFGGRIARFQYDGIFEEILDRLGETPLPPYIHEKLEDKERYQTVYNRERGSAAAPTAGLHFTRELLQKIRDMGVEEVFVTLHVGLGTFRPVNESRIEDTRCTGNSTPFPRKRRTPSTKPNWKAGVSSPWAPPPYGLESAGASGEMKAGGNWTSIFIYPGYQFRFVDAW